MHGSIEKFLSSMSANGASPNTLKAYRSDLEGFLAWCEAEGHPTYAFELPDTAAAYLTAHRGEWAPATTSRKAACLKKFGAYLGVAGYLTEYRVPTPAKGIAHPIPEGIDAVRKMMDKCYKHHHRALIAMCGLLGLRVSEARSVMPSDFQVAPATGRVLLTVRGKGDKTRVIPVSPEAEDALRMSVTVAEHQGTAVVPIDDRSARRAITRAAKRAGLGHVASHDLRMTFGTEAYRRSGGNLRAVQDFLGHASSKTTESYTGVSMDDMASVASF